jgi:hypothetical protein
MPKPGPRTIYKYSDLTGLQISKTLPANPLSGFHQWADDKDFLGGFLTENSSGEKIWILIVFWNDTSEFYVVLFPEDRIGPIAEIHKVANEEGDPVLRWSYSSRKRDGKNEERKQYFEKYFGSTQVLISAPSETGDVADFLNELLSLAENRKKADELDPSPPEFREGFPEGKAKEKLHVQRERNSALIRAVKNDTLKKYGKLQYVCCGFDFAKVYGDLGSDFIEAHHTIPVSELHKDGEETKMKAIALVCSNCHRMLHRRRPWLKMNALKKLTRR